jgi:hypothetical protein
MATDLQEKLLNSVEEQIRDLQPGLEKQVEIAAVLAELGRLDTAVRAIPVDASINSLISDLIAKVTDIQSGETRLSAFGKVLGDLYGLQQSLEKKIQELISNATASDADRLKLETLLLNIIVQVRKLLNYRPDVGAIMDDLTAIKKLSGGPADATAFHDFHVLQMAFRSVWLHAFDGHLKSLAAQLYHDTVRLYDYAGITVPPVGAIDDINQLKEFIKTVETGIGQFKDVSGPPTEVLKAFPTLVATWNLLSVEQRFVINLEALVVIDPQSTQAQKDEATKVAAEFFKYPDGPAGRLSKLILEIGRAVNEPYAFDVFAPDSFNYGLMITYRQQWEPGEYQAGDLAATIPLAPGETRKYSKKRIVKKSRAEREIEKSMSSRSLQSSDVSRAEAEIMQKATTATNFKMTAHGSFNIGIGSISSTSEFGVNQEQLSALNKRAFHEATIKAAEEYRLERSMQIDTTSSVETEETVSGEISNPNTEITVTYLFYELQRRFKIHELLYRIRPVILVAQDVPAPHEIDEAWLIQYQWIIARVLLDDSFRPALDYLTSGFAGDEVSVEVIKAHWEELKKTVSKLEGEVTSQLGSRQVLREYLMTSQQQVKVEDAKNKLDVANFFLNPFQDKIGALQDFAEQSQKKDVIQANREAAETRLKYVEQALADAQEKYRQASGAFQQATNEFAGAMQNQFARHIAIDQLRVHVKQNIFYYMQAIWDQEPPDQRFFRLYNKKVICPQPDPNCIIGGTNITLTGIFGGFVDTEIKNICVPGVFGGISGLQHELVEVADLDNPLGYKGNYIIFPLKDQCYLTTFMLTEFIDKHFGVRDADGTDSFDEEEFRVRWNATEPGSAERRSLEEEIIAYITAVRRSSDEIIIPTGQLFIEALPGSHPLLEDFKLLHRFEDVRKVKAEVRHAELENLRLASRLVAGQNNTELLEDPNIEKKILVEGNASVVVNPNP